MTWSSGVSPCLFGSVGVPLLPVKVPRTPVTVRPGEGVAPGAGEASGAGVAPGLGAHRGIWQQASLGSVTRVHVAGKLA